MFLTFKKFNDYSINLTSWLAIIIMGVITVVVGIQVFTRIILNNTVPWSEEVARMLTIWLIGLGASIGFRKGENMGVNFFVDRIPIKQKNYVELFVYLAIGYFLLVFLRIGMKYTISNLTQLTPILQIHYSYFSGMIPISVVLMISYTVEKIFEIALKIKNTQ